MYYYIVDPQNLSQAEFERVQNQLYSSVSEYRVSGEVIRATGLRTVAQLVESAFSHGARTIVAVGSDGTLQELINAVGGREITLGFIPIVPSAVGDSLGIKTIAQGAKTIAARRIAEMDLGAVNNNLFFTTAVFGALPLQDQGYLNSLRQGLTQGRRELPQLELKFSADEHFEASLPIVAGCIQNLGHPTDGYLDVLLLPQISGWTAFRHRHEILRGEFEKIPGTSVLHVKKIEIHTPEGLAIRSEGRVLGKTPAVIEIKPKALKIIVGRERKF